MLSEDGEEEVLSTLADLGGGRGEELQGGEEVNDQGEDEILVHEVFLEEEQKKREDAEEQDQEYTGPAVVEYEHDVAMPNLMTGEQFEAAMEAQFLQPHRVSMQARRTVLRKRAVEGGKNPAGNDALVLFALLRPHPTRWYVWEGEKDLSTSPASSRVIPHNMFLLSSSDHFYAHIRWSLDAAQANFFLTERGTRIRK